MTDDINNIGQNLNETVLTKAGIDVKDKETESPAVDKADLAKQVEELEKQDAAAPGVKTEMTSIIDEEKKTPEAAPHMTAQDYVDGAIKDYMGGILQVQKIIKTMSKRSLCRALVAVLKLPEEGQKVNFQSDEERMVFGIGQRILNARTTLILNHMQQKMMKENEAKMAEQVVETKTSDNNEEIKNGNDGTSTSTKSE